MTDIPIKIQFVKSLSTAQPSRIVAVKADGDPTFSLYVTDKSGIPYPIKEAAAGTITAIQNTDGNLVITGLSTKTINVAPAIMALINSALQAGDNVSDLTNDANYITLADVPTFVPSNYDLEDFTNTGADPFVKTSEITNGITNLSYTVSTTQGTVNSDTGTNASIPLADATNAGLLSPADKIKLNNTSGVNSGDQSSIVGITGTKLQFNSAVTDGDILYVGDITQYTDELAQDAVGNILTDTSTIDFTYDDSLNTISADVKPNSITATQLDNNINVSEFINDSNYANISYVDGLVVGLLDDRGSYDASTNVFPSTGGSGTAGAVLKGDIWYVSVAGTLGGQTVNIGDSFRALVDSPAQIATNWSILEANIGYVPENVANKDSGTLTTSNTTYPTSGAVKTVTDSKQATLVSGTNIKTINQVNLLGSGDTNISTSTAVIDGCLIINNGATFDVTPGFGEIVSNTYPLTRQTVTFAGITSVTPLYPRTLLYIDNTGTLQQQNGDVGELTPIQLRDNLDLGLVIYFSGVILAIQNTPSLNYDIDGRFSDLSESIGVINKFGNLIGANGANLQINKGVGLTQRRGSNYAANRKVPDVTEDPAIIPVTAPIALIGYRNGVGGWTYEPFTGGNITPQFWDNGTGVKATVSNNKFTNQRIYFFNGTNTFVIYLGQTEYLSMDEAITGVNRPDRVVDTATSLASLRSTLIVKKETTALNNPANARFLDGPRINGGASGSAISSQNLQGAYLNSVTPQITTTTALGAMDIMRGSTSDTDNILRGLNGAGSPTFSVTGAGSLLATSYNGYTPENVANKDNGTLTTSSATYPTSGAVKTAVDSINKFINAADFGFLPTATATDNSAALNAVLLGGNRTVIVSKPGTYLLNSTVWIDDYTNLIFGEGVILQKAANYTIVLANRGALTRATNTNIKIKGCKLVIDGFEADFSIGDPLYGLKGNLSFFHIDNLELINTEILDLSANNWGIQVCTFDNIHIDGVIMKGQKDGVHLGRGRNFLIENGIFETYDDGIALNGHDYTSCNPEVGNIEDGVIRNVTDLYKSPSTGYFSRHLIGAWVDWYSGIQVQKGDAIVHDGKTYRIEGGVGIAYNSAIFPTIPGGQYSVVAPEGFTLIFCSNDAVYSANIVNVKYEDVKCYNNRVTLRGEVDLGSDFNRSIHPDVDLADYPSMDVSVSNLFSTSTATMLVLPADIYSKISLTNCTTASKLILANATAIGKSKIVVDKCDFRNIVSGDVMTLNGSDVTVNNSIYTTSILSFFGAGTGTRFRSSDNITGTTFSNLTPVRGDYIVFDNVSKVYNGTIWVDQDVLVMGNTTTGYLPKSNGASLTNSIAYENGTGIGVNTTSAADKLDVNGGTIIGTAGSRLHLNTNSLAYNRNVNTGAMFNASAYGYQWQKTNSATQGSDYLALQVYNTTGGTVTNSAFVVNGFGNIGLRTLTPTARFHLPTGTTAATTAPLKFNSGSLMTTPETGAVEFLDDKWYGTITTGVARKTFAFLESPALTGTPTAPTAAPGTTGNQIATLDFVQDALKEELAFALSDETSNLTVGTLLTFRMPFAMTLSEVRIGLNNAPTVSSLIVDVKEAGVSIFSTLLSIDATEKTSVTAATPAVISDVNLADDAEITIMTTQIGSGDTGKGLKILFKGKRT